LSGCLDHAIEVTLTGSLVEICDGAIQVALERKGDAADVKTLARFGSNRIDSLKSAMA
jgi:hypothetical protein